MVPLVLKSQKKWRLICRGLQQFTVFSVCNFARRDGEKEPKLKIVKTFPQSNLF